MTAPTYPEALVERVAIALHDREARCLEFGLAPFDKQPNGHQEIMRARARTALEASGLREAQQKTLYACAGRDAYKALCEELTAERDALQQRERELVEALEAIDPWTNSRENIAQRLAVALARARGET